ncbi:hypothetical protein HNV11_09520 [Spirosoma taeanense]|uniref:Uncharacterized protein n=1 Tax=Spirosoma taeanense TaxID=2735870 RepID=A0A6M5Y7Z3_9BACT|nr:hypothetical protein [Spirosoma taeanense]QJW89604.1 hypothetical protein HNV11_09520 [Spirosoma taeanense]
MNKTLRNLLLFGFIWGCSGFFLGCLTLMGPVRWVVSWSRAHAYSDTVENWLVRILILLLAGGSFWLARKVRKAINETQKKSMKWGLPVGVFALATLALSLFMNPAFLNSTTGGSVDTTNKEFTFGPYPTAGMLVELKKEGYVGVISLLHPAVTPFEPVLLNDERTAGRQIGINIISVPMLPWISQNEEPIRQIREIAANPQGRYYVHCYLGKDRVNVVKRIISGNSTASVNDEEANSSRSLNEVDRFERGPVVNLGNDVYLTPYPTDEEYLGYLIAAGVKQVVCVLEPTDSEAAQRIQQEEKTLKVYQIAYLSYPIPEAKNDKEIAALLEKLRDLPRPLVIHRFFSDQPIEKKIVEAYRKRFGNPTYPN